jgi:NAD(P)-dependent dehydrogenase (short-subunit alcohol dehydrogenase family)
VTPLTLDVRDAGAWRAVLESFTAPSGGRLDVLVNNAGILNDDPLAETDPQRLRDVVEVNLVGAVLGCRLAHPHLRRSPLPRVVNVCSATAAYGQPSIAAYAAAKAGTGSLTEALRRRTSSRGAPSVSCGADRTSSTRPPNKDARSSSSDRGAGDSLRGPVVPVNSLFGKRSGIP